MIRIGYLSGAPDHGHAASQELEKIGAPAVGPLTQSLQGNHTLDFRSRIDQVLRKLAIHEEGGEVVNGLKLRLVASKNGVKLGDSAGPSCAATSCDGAI